MQFNFRKAIGLLGVLASTVYAGGCIDRSGNDDGIFFPKVSGLAASQTGEEGTLNGWFAVLIESATAIARVSSIDKTGVFRFDHITTSGPFTLVILSPEMKISSLAFGPGTAAKKVRTLFTIENAKLPKLIVKGLGSQFAATDGIRFQGPDVDDKDEDGVPDGMKALALLESGGVVAGNLVEETDTDGDGVVNSSDSDIDGDGMPNVVDGDDDGDGILDGLDSDANGDGVEDSKQTAGDAYFPSGLTYFSALYTVIAESATVNSATLVLKGKLREGVAPQTVTIRGPDAYFKQSKVGADAWDGGLLDDGKSSDGDVGDGVYGRALVLADTSVVKPQQIIFLQLGYGVGDDKWYEEFPFMFPSLSLQSVGVKYDRSTRTVSLDGTPFGTEKGYTWSVTVYNSAGSAVYTSDALKGTATDYVIPVTILEANKSYKADVTGQLLDRIPGNPCCASRSPKIDLQ